MVVYIPTDIALYLPTQYIQLEITHSILDVRIAKFESDQRDKVHKTYSSDLRHNDYIDEKIQSHN